MSTQAVKEWLRDRIVNSLSDPTGMAYPRDLGAGLLFAQGFDTSNVTVFIDEPADEIAAQTSAAITLADTQEEDIEPAERAVPMVEQTFEIKVLWRARFMGDPELGIAPLFTDEPTAARRFRLLIDRLKQTLRYTMWQLNGPGDEVLYYYLLTDPDTGEQSVLEKRKAGMLTQKLIPGLMENGIDRYYGAYITAGWIENLTS